MGRSWDLAKQNSQKGAKEKKHEKYKIFDERIDSYWIAGLVELIFRDWF
jgi:hypothetical protein